MKKISVFIIGLFALLIVNNVSAQQVGATAQQAAAPLTPNWTKVYFNVTTEPGVDLSTATLTLKFINVYLPYKQTQEENLDYNETFSLDGDETVFWTRYYMGHGTVYVRIGGLHAYGNGSTYFVEDPGSDYCNYIYVDIHVVDADGRHDFN